MSQSSQTSLTLVTSVRDDNHTRIAHERWYQKQPTTHCRRCDREFPNVNGDRTEFCSRDCEVGYFPPKPEVKKCRVRPRHLKHLPVGSFRSNWS